MLAVPMPAAQLCWWLCLCFLSPCSHFPSYSPIVSKKQLFGILWVFFSFYFFPEENSIVLFIVVTARLLAATSFCSSCSPTAAGVPGCAWRSAVLRSCWICSRPSARCSTRPLISAQLCFPSAELTSRLHPHSCGSVHPSRLQHPNPVSPCPGCAGLCCNPNPPSAQPCFPLEFREQFWLLGWWISSCWDQKRQLAFGVLVGKCCTRCASACSGPGWANRFWVCVGSVDPHRAARCRAVPGFCVGPRAVRAPRGAASVGSPWRAVQWVLLNSLGSAAPGAAPRRGSGAVCGHLPLHHTGVVPVANRSYETKQALSFWVLQQHRGWHVAPGGACRAGARGVLWGPAARHPSVVMH